MHPLSISHKNQERLEDPTEQMFENSALPSDSSTNWNTTHLFQQEDYTTTFTIVIDKPDRAVSQKVAKIDTGAGTNLISQRTVAALGLDFQQYRGPRLKALGSVIQPIGTIKLIWHACQKPRKYGTTFAVIDDKLSRDFEILLGDEENAKRGFLKPDRSLFFCYSMQEHGTVTSEIHFKTLI